MTEDTLKDSEIIRANLGLTANLIGEGPILAKMDSFPAELPFQKSCADKTVFFLIGDPTYLLPYLSILYNSYVGKVEFVVHLTKTSEEAETLLDYYGALRLPKAEEFFDLLEKEKEEKNVKPYLLTFLVAEDDLTKQIQEMTLPVFPFPVFEFFSTAIAYSINMGLQERIEAPLLKELFVSGDYEGPFYLSSSSKEDLYIPQAIACCAKKVDKKTTFYLTSDLLKSFKNDAALPQHHEVAGWELLEAPKSPTSEMIFVGDYANDEEALKAIDALAKSSSKPKEAYIVVRGSGILPYFEKALSKKAGCPIKAFNDLCPIMGDLDELYEEQRRKERVYGYLSEAKDNFLLPFSDKDLMIAEPFGYHSYRFQVCYCSYSLYSYADAYEGKQKKDLFGEDNIRLIEAIENGEFIPSEWFYNVFLRTLRDSNSLLYHFAEHEHALWLRRSLLSYSRKDMVEKSHLMKPLYEFGNEQDDLDEILKDYSMSIAFLFECFAKKKRKFEEKEDLANRPIDLAALVKETDIDGKRLEKLISSTPASELKVEPLREVPFEKLSLAGKPGTTRGGIYPQVYLFGNGNLDNDSPRVGDIITIGGKPSFVVLQAFEVRAQWRFLRMLEHLFQNRYDNSTRAEFLHTNGEKCSMVLVVAKVNFLTPCLEIGAFERKLSILYSASYPSNSAEAVYFRKKVSDYLKIGEIGKKAFQTPISSKISLKKSLFCRNFDEGVSLGYRAMFADSLDEYGSCGGRVNEALYAAARAFEPPEIGYPYLDYDKDYPVGGLTLVSVPPIIDPENPSLNDDDEINTSLPSVFALPYPILHRSMLPYLACALFKEESFAYDLAKGRIYFEAEALDRGEIEYTASKAMGVEFQQALKMVFDILKDPNGFYMKKAYDEFEAYPFGQNKARAILYRLAKLGLFSEKAFYHSYIPISAESAAKARLPMKVPDLYLLSLINVAADVLKMELPEKEDGLEKKLEKHANECFDNLLFGHIVKAMGLRDYSKTFSDHAPYAYRNVYRFEGEMDRFELADTSLGARYSFDLVEQLLTLPLQYASLFFQYISERRIKAIFSLNSHCEMDAYMEESRLAKRLMAEWEQETISSWRLDGYVALAEGPDTPKTIRFTLPGRDEEAEFEVLARVRLLRRYYLIVAPMANLGYIDTNSSLVLVERLLGGGYDLETDSNILDAIYEWIE